MSFGALLRAKRNERGLTLEDVAVRVGLSVPLLSRIERDRENPPQVEIVMKLAKIIGIPADDLLNEATHVPAVATEKPAQVFAAYRRLGGGR